MRITKVTVSEKRTFRCQLKFLPVISEYFYYESVEHFYELLGIQKSSVADFGVINLETLEVPESINKLTVTCEFYSIMLNHTKTSLQYGTAEYRQHGGLLSFVAPGQVISGSQETNGKKGWIINFSPKFLQENPLLSKLNSFNFFSYDVNKALSLTNDEEIFLTNIVGHIKNELSNPDKFSKTIIQEELGLLLHYCLRIQERELGPEFKEQPGDIIIDIDNLLTDYYSKGLNLTDGLPTIDYLSQKLNITKKHLGKLVKSSINQKTTDYINNFIVNKAKHILLAKPEMNIKDISYHLGFSYPHYFNNVFKKYTGKTPLKYRK